MKFYIEYHYLNEDKIGILEAYDKNEVDQALMNVIEFPEIINLSTWRYRPATLEEIKTIPQLN